MSKRNELLNFLKGIGCLGVVFIHIPFPGIVGDTIVRLAAFAVPVFLMISGYYAYNAKQDVPATIWRRTKKILVITCYAFLFYFLYALFMVWRADGLSTWVDKWLQKKTWTDMLFYSNLDIIKGGHLWFLPSLIYAYLILYVIEKMGWRKWACGLAPVYIVVKIVACTYISQMGLSWHYRGNFYLGALSYVLMGYFIASQEKKLKNIPNYILLGLSLAGALLVMGSTWLLPDYNMTEIGVGPGVIALFIWAIKNNGKSINRKLENLGDNYSLNVYILHLAIAGLLAIPISRTTFVNATWYQWMKPVIVAGLAILVSMILHAVTHRKKGGLGIEKNNTERICD